MKTQNYTAQLTGVSNTLDNSNLAFHYTTGYCFEKIVADQLLKPATAFVPRNEKPILWFSSDPYWENTANKAIMENGNIRKLTMKETMLRCRGLIRFGINKKKLQPWSRLWKKAKMKKKIKNSLEYIAYYQGANPKHWYGITGAMSLDDIETIDVMENGEWVRKEY